MRENDIIKAALPLYPCFEGTGGMIFLRFTNVSILRIGQLELPIRAFIYDPDTKVVYSDEDGAAFEAAPTLNGLKEVIDDTLQAIEPPSRLVVFSWAVVAHALNGTLTTSVLRAWIGTAYNSAWFDAREALRRLRYELFDINENIERGIN